MDHMPLRIEQNISIMSVFNIEQVGVNSIARQTFHKSFLGLVKFVAEILLEECLKIPALILRELFLKVVKRIRIWNELEEP